MEKFKLKADLRTILGKGTKNLRKEGLIPAVLYGRGKENLNLAISMSDFRHLFREAGTSSIVNLEIPNDGQRNVLLQQIDYDVITGDPIHLDFYEVSMKEKLTTVVPLKFVGDSAAVIELSGTLVTNKDELEIECLPGDLPHEIEVDISVLSDFEAAVHVSDLKLPNGVEAKDEPTEMVVTVEPPRSEEDMAELEEPVSEELPPETDAEAPVAEEEKKED